MGEVGAVDLVEETMGLLQNKPPVLIGCVRRNEWHGWDNIWKLIRGNAILQCIGERVAVKYPLGVFVVWLRENREDAYDVLQFRGGPYRYWWDQDCRNLASLVSVYTSLNITGTVLFHEFDNVLRTRYYPRPADSKAVVEALMLHYHSGTEESPIRLKKDTQQGRVYCYNCPVKQRCDAKDMELGETTDWP